MKDAVEKTRPRKRGAGSANSDPIFSGNSGRFELTSSDHTLAASSSSEEKDDRHAQRVSIALAAIQEDAASKCELLVRRRTELMRRASITSTSPPEMARSSAVL